MHIWEILSAYPNLCGHVYSNWHNPHDICRRCRHNINTEFEILLIHSSFFSHLCVMLSQTLICRNWGKNLDRDKTSYSICRDTLCRGVVLRGKLLCISWKIYAGTRAVRKEIYFEWELIALVHGSIVLLGQCKVSSDAGLDIVWSAVFCPWS